MYVQISSGNNCFVLTVYIGGLPFLFPVSEVPIKAGRDLHISYGNKYWQVGARQRLRVVEGWESAVLNSLPAVLSA